MMPFFLQGGQTKFRVGISFQKSKNVLLASKFREKRAKLYTSLPDQNLGKNLSVFR